MADISQINLPNDNNNPYVIKDASVPHSSLAAASGGTDLSLVTTGEKYTWNSYTDTKVTQNAITTNNSNYEVLLSGTADNTTRTEGANKCNKITVNPNTGAFKCNGALTFGNTKVLKSAQLWQGSLSSGSVTYSAANYNYLIIFQNNGSDSNRKSIIVPVSMLSSTDKSFAFHTEQYFISFRLKISSGTVTMTYQNRSSGSSMVIRDVWGAN
jgi:hypothetical protein